MMGFLRPWTQLAVCTVAGILATAVQSQVAGATESELHMELQFSPQFYPQSPSSVVNHEYYILRDQIHFEYRFDDTVSFKVSPIFQADPANNSMTERYWADLPEGFFQFKSLGGLVIGFNTFTWGVTDVYNPLDIVSARRLEDPLNSEKLGAPSIALHTELMGGAVSLQGIYIPFQRKSILPGINSRWLPRVPFQAQTGLFNGQPATLLPPPTLDYNYLDDQQLDHALANNVGIRMEAHLPSMDLSFVAFDGAAPLPATDLRLTGEVSDVSDTITIESGSVLGVIPVYYRQFVGGGSATYALGEFILRGEAAFTRVISQRVDLPQLSNEYVLELEHDFSVGEGQVSAFLEGTYGHHSEPVDPSFISLNRMFDRGALLGVRYSPTTAMQFSGMFLEDTYYHGQLGHLEFSDSISDSCKISLGMDGLFGSSSTPIGTYHQNSRATASIRYSL